MSPKFQEYQTENSVTVTFQPARKVTLSVVCIMVFLFFLVIALGEGLFILEILMVVIVVASVRYFSDSLLTRDITFTPDSITVKRYVGQITIPARTLLLTVSQQAITFYHAATKNRRESCTILRDLLSTEDNVKILMYAEEVYHLHTGSASAERHAQANVMADREFDKTVLTYRLLGIFFIIYGFIAIFSVGLSENFVGFSVSLPAFPVRVFCLTLVVAGVQVVKRLAISASVVESSLEPLTTRLRQVENRTLYPAVIALGIGGLGLALFLMFGNSLDFFGMLLIGWLCYEQCYPRLSTWERIVAGASATTVPTSAGVGLQRRSLQVSLVLMGAVTALSYGETNHYLYNSRKDCVDDWGDGKDCQEIPATGGHVSTYRYYGPRYGSGSGRAPHAVGVGSISRGGFGSLGSFHASFGG